MQITGIIGAMDVEVAILRSMMKNARTETVSGIDFIIGSLEGRRVVLARSGVGKVFAALCAQTMILKFGVTEIVNSGVAGMLTPELHIGDVASPRPASSTTWTPPPSATPWASSPAST